MSNPISQIPDYLNDQLKASFTCPATWYGLTDKATIDDTTFPVCKTGQHATQILPNNLKPMQFFHKITGNIAFDVEDDEESFGLEIRSRFEVPMELVGIIDIDLVSKSCNASGLDIAMSLIDGLPVTPVDVSDTLKAFYVEAVTINQDTKDVLSDNFPGFDWARVDLKLYAFAIAFDAVGYKCENYCITV